MTGLFVVLMENGRLSQNINHCLEARTNGRGLFRSLKPSVINFPLQVQRIDCGHWTHRSFTRGSISSTTGGPISSAPNECNTTGQPGVERLSPGTGIPDEDRA